MQQEVCNLEDVLVKVTNTIYRDLKALLNQCKVEDREQRTRALKHFIYRSRKWIYQILALCNWSRKADTKKFFKALNDHSTHLFRLTNFVAFHVDRFFYINDGIFYKFSREHEIAVAYEMESRITYPFFSSRLLSSKTPMVDLHKATAYQNPSPISQTSVATIEGSTASVESFITYDRFLELSIERRRVLSIAIRGKLAIHDKLPKSPLDGQQGFLPPIQACINDGLLKIRCSEFFVAFLTLTDVKSVSDWSVVYFHILRKSDVQTSFSDSIRDVSSMNALDLETIQSINNSKEIQGEHNKLRNILSLMTQVVLKERIRGLTHRFVNFSRHSLFVGQISMPKYFDTPDCVEMREFFWNNEIGKYMSYMIRVVLSPFQLSAGVNIAVELYAHDHKNIDTTMSDRLSGSDQVYRLISRSSEAEAILFHLSLATDPMHIMTNTCSPLIQLKFALLHQRIKKSHMRQGMTIEIHPFSLVVSFPHDVFLHFVIDTTSGKTIVSSSGLGEYAELCQGDIQRISDDLNSVERETALLPFLSSYARENISSGRTLLGQKNCWDALKTKATSLPPLDAFLKRLQFVLYFLPIIDHPLVSLNELRELSSMLRKPLKSSLAFALQCWDVTDHQAIQMQHLRHKQRVWLEEQRTANNKDQSKRQRRGPTSMSLNQSSKVKVLYLFIQHKELPTSSADEGSRELAIELSSIICSSAIGSNGRRTFASEHFCTEFLTLHSSTNLSMDSIGKYVDKVLIWARKQFEHSLLVPSSFSQLILNQPINKARFGPNFVQDRFGVFVEETEGMWVDLEDGEFLRVYLYTSGTAQSCKWGLNKKQSTCPSNVLKAFKEKGLENPILYASIKLKLLTQVRSKLRHQDDNDEVIRYFVIKLEEFSINLKECCSDSNVEGNAHDHITQAAISSVALKCADDLLRRVKLPLEFEWLTLYPLLTSIRTALILVWTTTYYAYKGYVDLDSEVFIRPISIDRNALKTTIVFGLCSFESEEQADEARQSLMLDASRYCHAIIPCPNNFASEDEEEEEETKLNSKMVIIKFGDSEGARQKPIEVPCEKITFETSFDALSDLYQKLVR